MPKLRTPPPSKAEDLWAIIQMQRERLHISKDELAVKVHCSIDTVRRDAKYPEKIPLERLLAYFRVLGIPIGSAIRAIMVDLTEKMIGG